MIKIENKNIFSKHKKIIKLLNYNKNKWKKLKKYQMNNNLKKELCW